MLNQKTKKIHPQKFYCSQCHRRLWRVGGHKYFVNQNVWLEDFFCEEDGTILMCVSSLEQGRLALREAQRIDWQQLPERQDKVEP